MQKKIVKTVVVFLCVSLWGCVTGRAAEQKQGVSGLVAPVPDKAISMTVPHEQEKTFSLYGIELGESVSSIENKYRLVGCRKDVFYLRCAVLLDTRGVTGVSASDETTIFIVFENDHVNNMSMPVFSASLQQSQTMLNNIYGAPLSTIDNMPTWSNASGSIVLEENKNKAQPSVLKYTTSIKK